MHLSNNQGPLSGFTMIELVIIIVVIGILAATALPRFSNLSSRAYIATNRQVAATMRTAASTAHAAWIASGARPVNSTTVTLDSVGLSVNANGWPDAGMGTSFSSDSSCAAVFAAMLVNAPPTATVFDSVGIAALTQNPSYVVGSNGGFTNFCIYTLYNGPTQASPLQYFVYYLDTGAVVYN